MDNEQMKELITAHGRAIYGFCCRLADNRADADDLYQETFLKAMELREHIHPERNPKSYLISIAIGLSRNYRRKLARRQQIAPTAGLAEGMGEDGSLDISSQEPTPEEAVLSDERRAAIRQAADRLNDKLRLPLYMYYTAEMTVEEIAAVLDIPEGTVKSRLFLARQTMKKMLEDESG